MSFDIALILFPGRFVYVNLSLYETVPNGSDSAKKTSFNFCPISRRIKNDNSFEKVHVDAYDKTSETVSRWWRVSSKQ